MVLFSIVKFIYSAIKMIFQKKEKPRRRRFTNFKKICTRGLGSSPTSTERDIGESGIRRILHFRVIVAYGLMFATILSNMVAMRYVPYKYAPVLGTFSYIFVLLIGYFGLKERIDRKSVV